MVPLMIMWELVVLVEEAERQRDFVVVIVSMVFIRRYSMGFVTLITRESHRNCVALDLARSQERDDDAMMSSDLPIFRS
jgi:hypothetical protein